MCKNLCSAWTAYSAVGREQLADADQDAITVSAAHEEMALYRAFQAADDELRAAERVFTEMAEVAAGREHEPALHTGVELAQRRRQRASRALVLATEAFARGRPLMAAIWSLPDDL